MQTEINAPVRWPKLQSVEVTIRNAPSQTFVIDERYKLCKVLGIGAYGVVIAAYDRDKHTNVAIKKIENAWKNSVDGQRAFREMVILRHFHHYNIVRLLDVMPPELGSPMDDVYLVLEAMDADLGKIIRSSQSLTTEHAQFFIYQLLKALKYLHSGGVMHRDIKPGNLLIKADCTLKLGDFGLACAISEPGGPEPALERTDQYTGDVCTMFYRAPEAMFGRRRYDAKIDMWSVGCVLAEIFLRDVLFEGYDEKHQLSLILELLGPLSVEDHMAITSMHLRYAVVECEMKRRADPDIWQRVFTNTPAAAVDLIRKLLQFNPAKRISAAEALKHPFLASCHDPKTEPDCKHKLPVHLLRQRFENQQMIQDFAWEELYKHRPELRTGAMDKTAAYPTMSPQARPKRRFRRHTIAKSIEHELCKLPKPKRGPKRRRSTGHIVGVF